MDWIILALILAYAARVVFFKTNRCNKSACGSCPGCAREKRRRQK